jgi:hypothetical protein
MRRRLARFQRRTALDDRHCEQREGIRRREVDCFVAALLAMTVRGFDRA